MTQKLFLSYKREDNADGFVEKLYHALIDKGYDVWWDMQSMPARGLTFLTEIRDAVAGHDRLILVGSKLAYDSDYVKAEFKYALSVCKPVHTIMRNDAYEDIPETLRDKDVPNFKDDAVFDESIEHLLRHLEQDSAPLGDIHGTRPALPPWYIERDNIMGELENKVLIDSKLPVVVTSKQQVSALHGMGGIGKTTVASAFSKRCETRRYFTDGIFWLSLGKNPEITQRQADIGYIFGDERKEYLSAEIGLNRLQHFLANKKVLLILDDVWEKQHAEAFRVTGNFNRVLMTSRSRRLVTQFTGKDQSVLLDSLSIDEGIRLFDERLNRTADDERPHDAIERQIIDLLDGYTLAVALASAKLMEKGEDYAPRLLDRLQKRQGSDNPFRSLKLAEDDKQENVDVSLSLSYEDLTDDEQGRFRKLGVLAPNEAFTLDLMQILWADEDDEDSEDALEKLHNMALINRDENGLYEQHTVLRAYAIALLKREGEYDTNYHAYLQHITELGKQFNTLKLEEWRTLDDIIPHILYVGDTLTETYENDGKLAEIAYEFAYNTTKYVTRRPEMKRKYWLEMGLALAQEKDDIKTQSFFLHELARIYSELGENEVALSFYNQALPIFQVISDKSGEANTLNGIGTVYHSLGDRKMALDFFNQSLPLRKAVDDKSGEAATLNNIGMVYNALGEKEKALHFYNQALPLRKEVDDKSGEATTLNNIGGVYGALGEKEKALHFYNQALPMLRDVDNKSGEATTLNNIGGVYNALGEKEKALHFFNQALPMLRDVDNKSVEASTLSNIGAVYDALGEKEKAIHFYNQSIQIFRQIDDKSGEATLLSNIGAVYYVLGERQTALQFFTQSLPLRKAVDDKSGEATTLNNIGMVYNALGETEKALHFYNQSLPLRKEVDDKSGEATTLNNIGMVYSALGEKEKALHFFNQVLPLRKAIDDKSGEATTLNNIGGVYDALGEKEKALHFYNQALPMLRDVDNKSVEASTLNNIGEVYRTLGKLQEALHFYNQSIQIFRQISDPFSEFVLLTNIVVSYNQQGNLDEAINTLSQCVTLGEKIGHPETKSHNNILKSWQQERDAGA